MPDRQSNPTQPDPPDESGLPPSVWVSVLVAVVVLALVYLLRQR